MKKVKFFLFFSALIGFASMSYGQMTIKPGVGINITNWSKEPGQSTVNGNVGWQLGASIAFGKKLYFEPGLFYMEQSTEVTAIDEQTSTNFKFDNKISSLRIPVNIGYAILGKEGGPLSLRVFGGPTASIVTGTDGEDFLSKDDFKDINWGVQAGAGINLAMLYLDASYEWGINEFLKDMDEQVKLRGFFVTAGIKF